MALWPFPEMLQFALQPLLAPHLASPMSLMTTGYHDTFGTRLCQQVGDRSKFHIAEALEPFRKMLQFMLEPLLLPPPGVPDASGDHRVHDTCSMPIHQKRAANPRSQGAEAL